MQVQDIMDTHVLTISVNDYAIEARRLMAQHGRDWVIAVERAEVAGVVWAESLRSIPDSTLKELDVREFVSADLPKVSRSAKPREARRVLRQSGLHFLTVMENDWPVGVVTEDDLTARGQSAACRDHQQAG